MNAPFCSTAAVRNATAVRPSMIDLETAITDAARLSRALWLACRALKDDDEFHPSDEDLAGIEELAFELNRRCRASEAALHGGVPS